MKFAVMLLWITSVLFVMFGVAYIVAPQDFADLVTGVSPDAPSAVIDMRATYGGVALGLGLFVGICARRPNLLRQGLILSLLVVASIGAARLWGFVADGSPNGFMIVFLATEVVSVVLYILALRRVGAASG